MMAEGHRFAESYSEQLGAATRLRADSSVGATMFRAHAKTSSTLNTEFINAVVASSAYFFLISKQTAGSCKWRRGRLIIFYIYKIFGGLRRHAQ